MRVLPFRRFPRTAAPFILLMLASGCSSSADSPATVPAASTSKIDTIVVIFAENRSFDNLYGTFPGANGIAKALQNPSSYQQVDLDGTTPLPTLPPVWGHTTDAVWSQVEGLPNQPFLMSAAPVNAPLDMASPDLVHRFYQNQMQIHGGTNNMFASLSSAGGLSMGYYDGTTLPMFAIAAQYTLCDNFFMGGFGGSFFNHQYLIAAAAPLYPDAPENLKAVLDTNGDLAKAPTSPASVKDGPVVWQQDGTLTPDGYAVNTILPPYQPSAAPAAPNQDPRLANPAGDAHMRAAVLPPQAHATIGDRLTAKNIDWKWYAGLWDVALQEGLTVTDSKDYKVIWSETVGKPDFEPHHQPFNYFARFDPTTTSGAAEREAHLQDFDADMLPDIANGSLPPVSFYKPQGDLNYHPGYAQIASSDAALASLIAKLQASPQWSHMAIIITFDENGGLFDHVTPPIADRWGPGTRIPAIIISPYAKNGYVDSTSYDTTSILKFITTRFDLEPLAGVRAGAGDLMNAFDLTRP